MNRPYTKHGKQADAVLRHLVREYILESEDVVDDMDLLLKDGIVELARDFYHTVMFSKDRDDNTLIELYPLTKYRTGE